jgi:hypothetical protein
MNLWRGDEPFAGRTIDLDSGIAGVALDVLAASRAGEFEFSHILSWLKMSPTTIMTRSTVFY